MPASRSPSLPLAWCSFAAFVCGLLAADAALRTHQLELPAPVFFGVGLAASFALARVMFVRSGAQRSRRWVLALATFALAVLLQLAAGHLYTVETGIDSL